MATSKINYKDLPDATKDKTASTMAALATKFEIKELKVSQILTSAGVKPVGKIPVVKEGKPSVGKPALAFDTKTAREVIEAATKAEKASKEEKAEKAVKKVA